MNQYPKFPDRRTLVLDGIWDFAYLGDVDIDALAVGSIPYTDVAAVPGVYDTSIDRFGVRGVAVYRTHISFPVTGRVRLSFGGMGLFARIFWDGKALADYQMPYGPVYYDIDVRSEDHELVVLIDNRFGPRTPLFQPFLDFYGYGGIYRSVTLMELPKKHIERVHVETLDIHAGTVRLVIRSEGMDMQEDVSIAFDGGEEKKYHLAAKDGRFFCEASVPGHTVWSPEHPSLHTVTVAIGGDSITERFGIRTIKTRGQEILLNGKPVFLKGVNRHASHPEFGPVEPLHLMADDLRMAKDLGCNFIRTVHYPQDTSFLDLCDVMGFLVWEESIGWQINDVEAADTHIVSLLVEQTERMVREDINHPSIIFWAFINESCSHKEGGKPLYAKLAKTVREEDATRLVSYASCRREHDICFEYADVIAINNYPGWIDNTPDWTKATSDYIEPAIAYYAEYFKKDEFVNKPLIFTEIGTGALYGCHDRANAQWSEEFQAEYVQRACRAIMDNPRYTGVTLWQFFDTRSFVNAGQVRTKPRGFNCAGLVDEYRRPKMAYDAVKALFRAPREQKGGDV